MAHIRPRSCTTFYRIFTRKTGYLIPTIYAAQIFSHRFLFLDVEAEKFISLEKKVKKDIQDLLQVIKGAVGSKSRVRTCSLSNAH